MAIPRFNDDLDVIAKLADRPNDTNGMTAAQLKAKFDESGKTVQDYVNDTLLPYLESDSAASNMGIEAITGVTADNVQTALEQIAAKALSNYEKPAGGIPKSDLASAVQTSLGKADSAYQKPGTGIPKTDLAAAVQTSLGLADTALQTAPEEVYWATYGTTTYADILQAVYEKKIVCCAYQNRKYYLTRTNPSPACFTFIAHDANGSRYTLDLLQSGNTWSNANADAPHSIPSGGSSGQVLKKSSGTDYDVEWANESGGGGATEIFWATYGTTTYDEIGAALTAGKLPVCEYSGIYYVYTMRITTTRYFSASGQNGFYWLTVTSGNTWATGMSNSIPAAATATPANLGTAAVGSSSKYAKEDHVHNKPTYTASDVGAIAAPSSPSVGDFLVYTSNGWAAQSLSTWQGGSY